MGRACGAWCCPSIQLINGLPPVPPELEGRLVHVAGSFFDAPVSTFSPELKDVDVVILKHVLHDWNDADNTTILGNVATALAHDGDIIVIDHVSARCLAEREGSAAMRRGRRHPRPEQASPCRTAGAQPGQEQRERAAGLWVLCAPLTVLVLRVLCVLRATQLVPETAGKEPGTLPLLPFWIDLVMLVSRAHPGTFRGLSDSLCAHFAPCQTTTARFDAHPCRA